MICRRREYSTVARENRQKIEVASSEKAENTTAVTMLCLLTRTDVTACFEALSSTPGSDLPNSRAFGKAPLLADLDDSLFEQAEATCYAHVWLDAQLLLPSKQTH